MRQRLHESNAEKQRAYRARVRGVTTPVAVAENRGNSVKKARQPTRPARLQRLIQETEELADEYRSWHEAIPANLSDGPLADQLDDTITRLEAVAGQLAEIEPPRIGR
jgi:hypothetical protein